VHIQRLEPHKKRKDKENAKNWELSWLGSRLCKRESRRFIGDYVLTQQDAESGKIFEDAIGYGGFVVDVHYPRPEKPKSTPPAKELLKLRERTNGLSCRLFPPVYCCGISLNDSTAYQLKSTTPSVNPSL